MPARFPLRLALTKEQNEWLKRRAFECEAMPSEIVLDRLDAESRQEDLTVRLAELTRLTAESEARSRRFEAALAVHQEGTTAYLDELSARAERTSTPLNRSSWTCLTRTLSGAR